MANARRVLAGRPEHDPARRHRRRRCKAARPDYFAALVEGALGGPRRGSDASPAAAPFDMATPYSRDALIDALRPAAPTTSADAAAKSAAVEAAAATPEPAAPGTAPADAPVPGPTAAAAGWVPTHTIPTGGMVAWVAPDPKTQSVALAGGLLVAVVERNGGWRASSRRTAGPAGWTAAASAESVTRAESRHIDSGPRTGRREARVPVCCPSTRCTAVPRTGSERNHRVTPQERPGS